MNRDQADALRKPFPKSAIGRMNRGQGVVLDFVGHAATTQRLIEVDPEWSWEPLAFDERGLPAFDHLGGLWIRLTICGTTRLGYGDAAGKKGPNAVKEAIGDAIRNAAMRFGVALDLWAKEDISDTGARVAHDSDGAGHPVPDDGSLGQPDADHPAPSVDTYAESMRSRQGSRDAGGVTKPQLAKLGVLLKGQSRDQALAIVSSIVGRDIGSRNDLTMREAGAVIDALEAQDGAA